MSIARKLEMILAALLMGAVLLLGFRAWVESRRADTAQENYQAAAGDARAATVYVKAYKEVAEARRKKDAEVETVLGSEREWADAPVPVDVADLLRNPEGTTRAVP